MKVCLDYEFIFDPEGVWASTEQFESDLFAFFLTKQFMAEQIKVNDNDHQVKVFLQRVEPTIVPTAEPDSLKKIKTIGIKRGFDGKFRGS